MVAEFRTFRRRFLEPRIAAALADTRIVTIVGARQVGKSTLARHLAKSGSPYLTFDNLATLAAAKEDPHSFIRSLPRGTVIDEVQHLPEILTAIKSEVDENPVPGRFLLTGSANFLTIPTLSESLAGRMELFTLLPLAQNEMNGSGRNFVDELFSPAPNFQTRNETLASIFERVTTGGYPEVLARSDPARRSAWFESYVATILQRDIRELGAISDLVGAQRLLRLCAARSASLVNETALASEVGLTRKTTANYLDYLEQLFLLWRLPAFSRERGRRVSKAPKLLPVDTGLAAHLFGADSGALYNNRSIAGGLLETFVANELRAQSSWATTRTSLFHYREYDGLEIDLVLERPNGALAAIEVKATASPGQGDFKGMRRFRDSVGSSFARGVLLYGGETTLSFGPNLHAVPMTSLWA
uniref:ATPase, AAA+ superfamily n=1 Tax=mine drainage metagenome TaxID=410659 RepID=E6Q5Z9_9ZZZZ